MSFTQTIKAIVITATLAITGTASALPTAVGSAAFVVPSSTFADLTLGSVNVSSLSNLDGSLGFIESGILNSHGFSFPVTYSSVSFSGLTFSSGAIIYSAVGDTFSFLNVHPGNYILKASGTVGSGIGGLIVAVANVSPVPEPKTYAMFLAGLCMIGVVAGRRMNA